jgi:hypothetical protein
MSIAPTSNIAGMEETVDKKPTESPAKSEDDNSTLVVNVPTAIKYVVIVKGDKQVRVEMS